jgi:hypothetical protein
MPETSVASEVHKPFDVHGNFGSKFPFYLEFVVYYLTNAVDLSFGEIVCIGIGINLEFVKDPIGSGSPDTVNIGQTDFYPFTPR